MAGKKGEVLIIYEGWNTGSTFAENRRPQLGKKASTPEELAQLGITEMGNLDEIYGEGARERFLAEVRRIRTQEGLSE